MKNGFYLAIGKQGSGKTLFITKLTVDSLNNTPRQVYSNYDIKGYDFKKITLNKDVEKQDHIIDILDMLDKDPDAFNNSILLLDEIHIYLDSLDFMRKNNRRLQVFFSQLRKRNILLLATTQYIMNVDIRIRRQCMAVFEMKHLKKDIFQVTTHEIDGYYTEEISQYLVDLSDYYNNYNTLEIII